MKKWTCFLFSVVLMLSFSACGSGSSKASYNDSYMAASEAPASYDSGFYDEGYYTENSNESVEVTENANSSSRKLIKTYGINVETEDFSSLLPAIQARVTDLGGYIESLDTYNGSKNYYSTRHSNLKVRVPADKADEFISFVGDSSNITNQSLNVTDVTLSYVDMKSEKDAYVIEQERLLALLEKAETIEDMITIESRLSTVRYNIESMESQLRTYDNLVDYSTINIYVEEVKEYTAPDPVTYGERVKESFTEGIDSFVEGCGNFFVWFVGALPRLILLAVIIVIVVIVVKKTRKKKVEKAAKKAAMAVNTTPSKTPEVKKDNNEE